MVGRKLQVAFCLLFVNFMASKCLDLFAKARSMMVEFDILRRGIRDQAVLNSMRIVPRHLFVDQSYQMDAYNDHPLPIGYGQTISQPFIVALMAEAAQIQKSDKVLEIGTGSGYGAAVLSHLAKEVYTVETIPELAEAARARLASLKYNNVQVKVGDGSVGWPEAGLYDVIVVTAAAPRIPFFLKMQLREFGRLLIPVRVGGSDLPGESLMRLTRIPGPTASFNEEYLTDTRFVPLVGQEGFPAAPPRE
jgi:protein-L-isoaspartate(D-aspartate) O-methyltransferase